MTRTPMVRRALAGACALTLLLAACGDDDGSDESSDTTASTEAETTESTEAPEETTASEPEEETTTSEAEEGDPEAVAIAESINLTIDDFAEGWVEEEGSDESEDDEFDQCFTTIDLASVTVGEAETPTFTAETPDGQGAQVVTMQTVVFDTPESATAALTELATQDFANCTQSGITGSDVEGVQASLTAYGDEQPIGEQSVGVAGAVQIPGEDGEPQQGRVDLHAIRTANVASFTFTLDIGETPSTAFEQTLTELYTLIAERQTTAAG